MTGSGEKKSCAARKMAIVMREFKQGTLRDARGNKVTDRDMALAIAISEGKRYCK